MQSVPGKWVFDPSYPFYDSSKCPFIDPEFDCLKYGRPDKQFLKYAWKPDACSLPRFNGCEFLGKWRGKKIMFVGDSLSLNMWESLACMIHARGWEWNQPKGAAMENYSHCQVKVPSRSTTSRCNSEQNTGDMKKPVYLLDITTLSQLRKDAHPSTYNGQHSGNDCSPGVSPVYQIHGTSSWPYCEYVGSQVKKQELYAGPVVPESPKTTLEEQWEKLLSRFGAGTVIFRAFGSECVLEKIASYSRSTRSRLDKYSDRMDSTRTRSRLEFLTSRNELLDTRLEKLGSKKEYKEDRVRPWRLGATTTDPKAPFREVFRDPLWVRLVGRGAVKTVMDDGNELGKETRANRAKWKGFLLALGSENSYMYDILL
ncbi:Protein trichome birefringence-like 39 [Hibiscus syriacus]|uniref:Protein trichome birefringence-like 39 n=1 Tax=Hibiscus syriacus TaxID=106335 RepID=A0A6A2X137_HIBSY|nr:Protein trichome birefringence-like 39 [Hibiscus syriacus]